MSKSNSQDSGSASSNWKCGNCRHTQPDAPDNHHDTCPECEVEQMTEMEQEKCPNCRETEFEISSNRGGGFQPQPTVECSSCGRTGEIDEDGVWW